MLLCKLTFSLTIEGSGAQTGQNQTPASLYCLDEKLH